MGRSGSPKGMQAGVSRYELRRARPTRLRGILWARLRTRQSLSVGAATSGRAATWGPREAGRERIC